MRLLHEKKTRLPVKPLKAYLDWIDSYSDEDALFARGHALTLTSVCKI